MAEKIVIVQPCPVCGTADALVTTGCDLDSRGQRRRAWIIEVDCANDACPTASEVSR